MIVACSRCGQFLEADEHGHPPQHTSYADSNCEGQARTLTAEELRMLPAEDQPSSRLELTDHDD